MRFAAVILISVSLSSVAQSLDGEGVAKRVDSIPFDPATVEINYRSIIQEDRPKYKRGELQSLYQWVDFTDENGTRKRLVRDYDSELFYYREEMSEFIPSENMPFKYGSIRLFRNKVEISEENMVYHGRQEVYRDGFLYATLYFENSRPTRILLNHYYSNNQLQFVREITSEGIGSPFRNVGVLESYYPDGRAFETPLTNDGQAILIMDDSGVVIDECACIGQDIMEWDTQFLYGFMGKFLILLETIYLNEGMECCDE